MGDDLGDRAYDQHMLCADRWSPSLFFVSVRVTLFLRSHFGLEIESL